MYAYVPVQLEDKVNVDNAVSFYIYLKNILLLYILLSDHFPIAVET